jgi:hypothetical protein
MPESNAQPANPNESTKPSQPSPHDAFGVAQNNVAVADQAAKQEAKAGKKLNPSAPEDANTTPGSVPKK